LRRTAKARITKDERRLHIGLLGGGPISQAAHLDAIRKSRNADRTSRSLDMNLAVAFHR
jgi:hypothetical protein